MKFRQIKPGPMRSGSLGVLGLVLLLCACGGGGGGSSSDTGSISFRLDWVHPGPQRDFAKSPSGDVCVDYLIDTVRVAVQNSSGTTILTQSWDCDIPGRTGTIDKVPEGSGYALTVDGVVAGDNLWNNQTTGIAVTGGQDTNIGTIEMVYNGNDSTPPAVAKHYPADGESEIFRNIDITATFTEDVVAHSVNTSTTLIEDGTSNPVSYTVEYNASTNSVTLAPGSNLSPNTTYRVTILKTVEDRAGLTMAADESWTFTTSDAIGDPLVWDDSSRNWDESLWQ